MRQLYNGIFSLLSSGNLDSLDVSDVSDVNINIEQT